MVNAVFVVTGVVVIVKLAVVVPAAMVTALGNCAADTLLLCKRTSAPPLGAGPFSVTVPVELAPPTTEVGLLLIEDKLAALTLRDAVRLAPNVAVMVMDVLVATAEVVTVKVVEVLPAGTVTEAGTLPAPVLLLDKAMASPPVGAAPLRVTVPVDELPQITVVGFRVSEMRLTVAGVTLKVAVRVEP
jgi:hypothetical protein